MPDLDQKMTIGDVLRSADPERQIRFEYENDKGYCALGAIITVTDR